MKKNEKGAGKLSNRMIRVVLSISIGTALWGCGPSLEERARRDEISAIQNQDLYVDHDIIARPYNAEEYAPIQENEFHDATQHPLSTFSIDVDKASYSNIRRFLTQNEMPPKDAVRIEEMVNYFKYDYPQPTGEDPFAVQTEMSQCPWNKQHQLINIGIQGKSIDHNKLSPSNLVFLIDVSGSMNDANKLPLLKASLKMLVEELSEKDHVALVAYAGSAGLVLPSTSCKDKETIIDALDDLSAGGSTAGGEGIKLAYKVAKENLIEGGNNRVILATDGDFNVGVSSPEELLEIIRTRKNENIYLTVCGFGSGNFKDGTMEKISDQGNGNYFYIDNIQEAKKVFVTEMRGNMFTIAKDVKIQIEFNPAYVQSYRLVGYENRLLNKEDFNNDKKDAGELGAGHTVTALYEIVPVGAPAKVDKLRYQTAEAKTKSSELNNNELMLLKLRYKPIHSDESKLIKQVVFNKPVAADQTSDNFRFAAAVAGFGMLLRESENVDHFSYADDQALAKTALSKDEEGYRAEFAKLIETASLLGKGKEE
ncbi:MAG TPA: VWA domain-containing protein [Bacteroidia bacterium]|nr:VWA domain-containing protein [Bacteroidia bacterium]